jgi:large subunit ribosomal protein L28
MSKRCMVTGKGPMSGNNVSHANNRTRRRFMPGVKKVNMYSEALGRSFKVKISNAGLRTIEHKGGFDAFIATASSCELEPAMRRVRSQVQKAIAAKLA